MKWGARWIGEQFKAKDKSSRRRQHPSLGLSEGGVGNQGWKWLDWTPGGRGAQATFWLCFGNCILWPRMRELERRFPKPGRE